MTEWDCDFTKATEHLSLESPTVNCTYERYRFDLVSLQKNIFCIFFGGLECVGHSFAYVAHFVFLRDGWIRTQRAAVSSKQVRYQLIHTSP
jgi:hypothetical protein